MKAVSTTTSEPTASGPPALYALMAAQYGVASSTQARKVGVSRAVEARLVREGALIRVLPGILAAGGVRPSFAAQAMAASLCDGVDAVSHGAAARLHRLVEFGDYRRVDVIGDRAAHLVVPPPVVRHHSRGPIGKHIVRTGAIPVTSIPLTLTLLAAAPRATRAKVSAAVDDALGRGVPAATIRRVATGWPADEGRGPALLLDLLAEHGETEATKRPA